MTYLRKQCKGCNNWLAGEFCGKIAFGMGCVLGPLPPREFSPEAVQDHAEFGRPGETLGEYVARHTPPRVRAETTLRAKDTQVAGDHYKKMGVEPWDVVDTWPLEQRIGAYRHSALKYLMRMGSKDQNAQEIAKGKHYMEKLLEVLREADDEQAALKQGENTGSIS